MTHNIFVIIAGFFYNRVYAECNVVYIIHSHHATRLTLPH